MKIKLTKLQSEELNYFISLEGNSLDYIVDYENKNYYLIIEEEDIEDLKYYLDFLIEAQLRNFSDSRDMSCLSLANSYRNIVKKLSVVTDEVNWLNRTRKGVSI